ncbi:hypothetical protein [Algoriphagus boritolerans]
MNFGICDGFDNWFQDLFDSLRGRVMFTPVHNPRVEVRLRSPTRGY